MPPSRSRSRRTSTAAVQEVVAGLLPLLPLLPLLLCERACFERGGLSVEDREHVGAHGARQGMVVDVIDGGGAGLSLGLRRR